MKNKNALLSFLERTLSANHSDLVYTQEMFVNKPEKGMLSTFQHYHLDTLVSIAKEFQLYTLNDFGVFADVSRERARQVFKKMGINFKKDILSKVIYLENENALLLKVDSLNGEKWKQLSCVTTKKEIYISNKGRIYKIVKKKIKSIEFRTIEFLNIGRDHTGRQRVSVANEDAVNNTAYLHILVAKEFCEVPEDLNAPIVRFKNNNYDSVQSSNLYWCNRD